MEGNFRVFFFLVRLLFGGGKYDIKINDSIAEGSIKMINERGKRERAALFLMKMMESSQKLAFL